MKRHDRIVDNYVFNFKESVRGLTVGAPVDFRGIVVGEVAAIYTRFDPVTKRVQHPGRDTLLSGALHVALRVGRDRAAGSRQDRRKLAEWLVDTGLRGQLRTGNLLTGQLYVALDFFPNAPKATIDWNANPPELPTVPGGLQSLQDSVTALVAKLNKIPFEGIGKDLRNRRCRTRTRS